MNIDNTKRIEEESICKFCCWSKVKEGREEWEIRSEVPIRYMRYCLYSPAKEKGEPVHDDNYCSKFSKHKEGWEQAFVQRCERGERVYDALVQSYEEDRVVAILHKYAYKHVAPVNGDWGYWKKK